MNMQKLWFALFQIWLVTWTTLFLIPSKYLSNNSDTLNSIPHFDKIVHMGIFFVFSICIYNYNKVFSRSIIITIIFTAFYGILIETLQRIVGRGFDVYDYIFDFIGALLFYAAIYSFNKIFNRKIQ